MRLSVDSRHPSPRTAIDLVALPDVTLEGLDPLVINLIVAREIPSLSALDIDRYVQVVDGWAAQIRRGLAAQESNAKHEPAYRHDPNLWRAGGMAVALPGPRIGIRYTADQLDAGNPALMFVHGVIDSKHGTCSNMPVLYLAIGHRLGWPLKGVVSKDHFWCRWDDGAAAGKGGSRFNLEATNAASKAGTGEFATLTDDQYAQWLRTPPIARASGSDFTSLTKRQLLGVFLQARAGFWEARRNWAQAERDLLLARLCFPKNRDILAFQLTATSHAAARVFTAAERQSLAARIDPNPRIVVVEPDAAPRATSGPRLTPPRHIRHEPVVPVGTEFTHPFNQPPSP